MSPSQSKAAATKRRMGNLMLVEGENSPDQTARMLDSLVVALGAFITVGWAMVHGLHLHQWADRHGVVLPRDAGAIAGLVVGLIVVGGWLT
jgi:hypothetical protein